MDHETPSTSKLDNVGSKRRRLDFDMADGSTNKSGKHGDPEGSIKDGYGKHIIPIEPTNPWIKQFEPEVYTVKRRWNQTLDFTISPAPILLGYKALHFWLNTGTTVNSNKTLTNLTSALAHSWGIKIPQAKFKIELHNVSRKKINNTRSN